MTTRVAVAACKALGLDELDARELVYRAALQVVSPDHAARLDRAVLPATYSRLRRYESFFAREYREAVGRSGIAPSSSMMAMIGRMNNEACNENFGPSFTPAPRKPRVRPRDDWGRFVSCGSAGPAHPRV